MPSPEETGMEPGSAESFVHLRHNSCNAFLGILQPGRAFCFFGARAPGIVRLSIKNDFPQIRSAQFVGHGLQ